MSEAEGYAPAEADADNQKKKKGKLFHVARVVGLILCILFGFTLLCNCVIIIKGVIAPEKPPSVLGITPMVVRSGSMSGKAKGHIEVGDLILVGRAEPGALAAGDVIAFMQGSVVVTHRIIKTEAAENGTRLFYTKGDANNTPDEAPVPEEALVGIYKARIPKMGDFAMFLQTPLGMVVFIGIPLLLFIVPEIARNRRSAKKGREKEEELAAELERLRRKVAQNADGGTAEIPNDVKKDSEQ